MKLWDKNLVGNYPQFKLGKKSGLTIRTNGRNIQLLTSSVYEVTDVRKQADFEFDNQNCLQVQESRFTP